LRTTSYIDRYLSEMELELMKCAQKRKHLDIALYDEVEESKWEEMYAKCMNEKYAKNTRHFDRGYANTPDPDEQGNGKVYVVPRIRTESYLDVHLVGVDQSKVRYCPISKGFGMQDVSSFTLGPVVGEGLCVVNAAFSKQICVDHITGNGKFVPTRVGHWVNKGKVKRKVELVSRGAHRANTVYNGGGVRQWISVDGVEYDAIEWLTQNKDVWFDEWDKWRRSIALSSEGNFHWADKLGDSLAFYNSKEMIAMGQPEIIDFVMWKKCCYIRPGYQLISKTNVFLFLKELYDQQIPIGLVHPKGKCDGGETPITRDLIRDLYDDPYEMACMPYVVAGLLLSVPLFEAVL